MRTTLLNKALSLYTRISSYLYTRMYANTFARCGKNLHIYGRISVVNSAKLTVGSNCTLNHACYINAYNPIQLGDDVTLSAHSSIISTGIDIQRWMAGGKCHLSNDGIKIGDHVWIGAHAQILSNVHIKGPYVVVAAGAVVTKDIEDSYCVVAGCPATIIKTLKKQ